MKKQSLPFKLLSAICVMALISNPVLVLADDTGPVISPPAVLAPLLITEVQTGMPGSGNASKEFIELYNTTDAAIDLTSWQLWYISATADSYDEPIKRILFTTDTQAQPPIVAAHGYFVLSGNQSYLPEQHHAVYDATLAANGHLRLVHKTDAYAETCALLAEDGVSWGTAVPPVGGASPAPAAGESITRGHDADGRYVDTESGNDFVVATAPTPGSLNAAVVPGPGLEHRPIELTDPGCAVPDPPQTITPPTDSPPSITLPPEEGESGDSPDEGPSVPASNAGLKPPQISELLPNPASPQTDADDEFIELYNPNDAAFDLSGYVLEMGVTTKRRYVIPAGTRIQPHVFLAFFSADTSISLSNTQGQVRLVDPAGVVLVASEAYGTAKDGQSWVLANGSWQWTIKPTPNALNVVSAPVAAKKAATSTAKRKPAAVKTESTAKTKKDTTNSQEAQTIAAVGSSRSPLHPAVLALIVAPAVLYGAYEYRRDVANKFHQFRSNRAARRALREGAKGR